MGFYAKLFSGGDTDADAAETGRQYAAPLLASMDAVETRAVSRPGGERLRQMTRLVLEYGGALAAALEED